MFIDCCGCLLIRVILVNLLFEIFDFWNGGWFGLGVWCYCVRFAELCAYVGLC